MDAVKRAKEIFEQEIQELQKLSNKIGNYCAIYQYRQLIAQSITGFSTLRTFCHSIWPIETRCILNKHTISQFEAGS
jgi:hypothetical protein